MLHGRKKEQIVAAAVDCARDVGYLNMTRQQVADYAGCATGLVSYYLGDMGYVRDAVMRKAIELKDLDVIAQGLAAIDPIAHAAHPDLKTHAIVQFIEERE